MSTKQHDRPPIHLEDAFDEYSDHEDGLTAISSAFVSPTSANGGEQDKGDEDDDVEMEPPRKYSFKGLRLEDAVFNDSVSDSRPVLVLIDLTRDEDVDKERARNDPRYRRGEYASHYDKVVEWLQESFKASAPKKIAATDFKVHAKGKVFENTLSDQPVIYFQVSTTAPPSVSVEDSSALRWRVLLTSTFSQASVANAYVDEGRVYSWVKIDLRGVKNTFFGSTNMVPIEALTLTTNVYPKVKAKTAAAAAAEKEKAAEKAKTVVKSATTTTSSGGGVKRRLFEESGTDPGSNSGGGSGENTPPPKKRSKLPSKDKKTCQRMVDLLRIYSQTTEEELRSKETISQAIEETLAMTGGSLSEPGIGTEDGPMITKRRAIAEAFLLWLKAIVRRRIFDRSSRSAVTDVLMSSASANSFFNGKDDATKHAAAKVIESLVSTSNTTTTSVRERGTSEPLWPSSLEDELSFPNAYWDALEELDDGTTPVGTFFKLCAKTVRARSSPACPTLSKNVELSTLEATPNTVAWGLKSKVLPKKGTTTTTTTYSTLTVFSQDGKKECHLVLENEGTKNAATAAIGIVNFPHLVLAQHLPQSISHYRKIYDELVAKDPTKKHPTFFCFYVTGLKSQEDEMIQDNGNNNNNNHLYTEDTGFIRLVKTTCHLFFNTLVFAARLVSSSSTASAASSMVATKTNSNNSNSKKKTTTTTATTKKTT